MALGSTLRKLVFHFLSHWMGYDRGDSFPIDFEPNGFSFGSESKGKLSPWSYPFQCERNWKYSFLSVLQRSQVYSHPRNWSLFVSRRLNYYGTTWNPLTITTTWNPITITVLRYRDPIMPRGMGLSETWCWIFPVPDFMSMRSYCGMEISKTNLYKARYKHRSGTGSKLWNIKRNSVWFIIKRKLLV